MRISDALGQVDAELAQHHARLAHRARAVLERLVPDGRQADEGVRIAGAERAHDDVVDAGRVLDHLEIDAAEAQLLDGRRPVGEEALLVVRVDPRARHDLGAVVRADVLLVGADDAVDGLARDEPLLDEQRLERADAQREDGLRLAVMVPVIVVVRVAPLMTCSLRERPARDSAPRDRGGRARAARPSAPHRSDASKRTL